MGFNYTDAFDNSNQLDYKSKQHDNAIELQGRKTYIFKLDKKLTDKSNIYNEANNSRLYLPHFEQRALYNTNVWQSSIGLNNYVETEENLSLEYNFARMVFNIRDLKDKISGKLTIKNIGKEQLKATLDEDFFILETYNNVILLKLNLNDYKSITSFILDAKSKCSLIDMEYSGDMESVKNIKKFLVRLVPNKKFNIEVLDRTYENCTDVIEAGDIILTNKYKLYQVHSVYPSGDQLNNYIAWDVRCNVANLAIANLPDDYRRIVERNRYNMPKVDKE